MAQFDVYRNANPASLDDVPYLLDVQSDLLEPLATRVVVPLAAASAMTRLARYLNPAFEVEGQRVVLSTAELAGVPRASLGPKIASLADRRIEIVRALDFLLSGI